MNLFQTRIPFFPLWPDIAVLDGIKVPLKSSPLSSRMRRRLLRGFYETAERELVKAFIEPGDRILEIGASIGILSCFLSRQAGNGGRVVSVEADPNLKRHFDAQLALNGLKAEWVNALCCPLWGQLVPARAQEKSFQPAANNLSGQAVASNQPSAPRSWLTAESICKQTGLQPTALMVDIEGSEDVWAERAPRLPMSLRTVITEFHPRLTGTRVAGQAIQSILNEGFRVAGLSETVLAFRRLPTDQVRLP